MSIAGIDIGTTGCKCTVYDVDGSLISEAYIEYNNSETIEHELDPWIVWENIKHVLKAAAETVSNIDTIGVTSFGEASILLDCDGNPLTRSLLYTNPKGKVQCDRLVQKLGTEYISSITGLQPSPMYSISKIMWLKENDKETFEKATAIHLFEDYIVYKLTGIRQIDYSLASRTMAFDIEKMDWDKKILDTAGINRDLLPKPVPIGSKAGKIKTDISKELGIPKDAIVVSCCHDQIAAAIGTGTYKAGMAVDGIGTVECITPVFEKKFNRKLLNKGSYAIVPFIDGKYVTYKCRGALHSRAWH